MLLVFVFISILVGPLAGEARDGEIQILDRPLLAPAPPVWPQSYEMQYTIELPYVATVQIVGLK